MHEFMTWFVGQIGAAAPFLPVIDEGLQHADRIIAIQMDVGAGFETLAPLLDPKLERQMVDLPRVQADQAGLYVMVNSFHQLKPEEARQMLGLIAAKRQPLAILEGNNDSLWQVFGMLVIVPLTILLTAPFVKPFRWERLLFTYFIPILPIVTLLDGFLALFKLYAPADLDELVSSLPVDRYTWRSGKRDNGRGGKIIYLLGYPVSG